MPDVPAWALAQLLDRVPLGEHDNCHPDHCDEP